MGRHMHYAADDVNGGFYRANMYKSSTGWASADAIISDQGEQQLYHT
jgi:hypothetical protein